MYRWERANAQHEVGHLARLAAIDRALARHPGLFVTGSGFRGVGIPDCVADGRATAVAGDRMAAESDPRPDPASLCALVARSRLALPPCAPHVRRSTLPPADS